VPGRFILSIVIIFSDLKLIKFYMKIIITSLLLAIAGTLAHGQTIEISGTVNNQKGQPVPYAFVRDAQHNYAT
jgi:hypothetical protein